MSGINWADIFLKQGITGAMLLAAVGIYLRVIRPEIVARELERDRLQAEKIKDLLDLIRSRDTESREREIEYRNRELEMRREHVAAWERRNEVEAQNRKEDREMMKEMVRSINTAIENNTASLERNLGLTLALGQSLGKDKHELIAGAERIIGKNIAGDYDTKEIK